MKNLSDAVGGVFVVENRSRESTMSDVTSAEVVSLHPMQTLRVRLVLFWASSLPGDDGLAAEPK
jgi:hypothetical protein